ncbi:MULTISPECIES: NAD-dependent epimerase/dehydratase family protein [unclassified Pseudomonas]|uniref:NAD-dependent epimerase/dehydratase family protein n=1 Tax=unclassified Pseudomonas TaxID=196821 RepID=UPI001462C9CF|nr:MULTISPECIES: NAD-dependent epimerase/dehydratase family protein [unclassified Pseudomonas]QJI20329.1 pyridine nucleotide transhydrogenase [Pseudomonas sp. ADAK21]QJI24517.1 pyridine nucleotide transhydrogenase [Pseudomonas sp. ADAK20]
MSLALIGFTGFVGSTLLKQNEFSACFRSTNIGEIDNLTFDTVVCAGAPAQKWIANQDPEADLKKIQDLIEHLKTVKCRNFVLISTVDVFKDAQSVDEDTAVDESGLHAYGLHRRLLERFVEANFADHLIIRLPGLVGPGLRKNVIFDFLNMNNLDAIDSRGVFQFYPMVNLWFDIKLALAAGLKLVHFTAEPIKVSEISELGFGRNFNNILAGSAAAYDMQTKHAQVFGSNGRYQYSCRDTVLAVRSYAQSEPLTIKADAGAST